MGMAAGLQGGGYLGRGMGRAHCLRAARLASPPAALGGDAHVTCLALSLHAAPACTTLPPQAHLPLLPGDGISLRAWSPQMDRMYWLLSMPNRPRSSLQRVRERGGATKGSVAAAGATLRCVFCMPCSYRAVRLLPPAVASPPVWGSCISQLQRPTAAWPPSTHLKAVGQ